MKIAMVFDGLQVGGIERVGADYAKIMEQLGHEITIVNLVPNKNEMEKHFPDSCQWIYAPYLRKFAPEQYAQLIKKGFWGKIAYPLATIVLSMFSQVLKYAYRIMGKTNDTYDIIIAFSGHFNDLSFVAMNFMKSNNKLCWLHGALYSYLLISDGYVNLYKKINNLIVLGDENQEEVFLYNKDLKLNIHKLYNPTFITENLENKNNIFELKNKFGRFMLMVSRFECPPKDHFTVAKSLELVRNKYGDDINLVFVGDGPNEFEVKQYVDLLNNNLKNHIFFEGKKYNVQDYYRAAFILVHASIVEGLPTVVLEAMANNLPVVVTDSKTGAKEILRESEYGLLCSVKDPLDMAYQIHRLCQDKDLYDTLKKKGKERIRDFQPETIKSQLNAILNSLVDKEK